MYQHCSGQTHPSPLCCRLPWWTCIWSPDGFMNSTWCIDFTILFKILLLHASEATSLVSLSLNHFTVVLHFLTLILTAWMVSSAPLPPRFKFYLFSNKCQVHFPTHFLWCLYLQACYPCGLWTWISSRNFKLGTCRVELLISCFSLGKPLKMFSLLYKRQLHPSF